MNNIRRAFEELATRGSARGAERILAGVSDSLRETAPGGVVRIGRQKENAMSPRSESAPTPRRGLAISAAAFVVVLAAGIGIGSLLPWGSGDGSDVASVPTLGPVEPEAPPMTVAVGGELSYFSYLPDLQLAWRAIDDGATEVCWRTPSGEGCASDLFYAPDTLVIVDRDQAIILTRPDVDSGEGVSVSEIVVTFAGGNTTTIPISTIGGIGLVYARVQLDGAEIESASAQ